MIKVWFTDFWPLFDSKDNFLIDILNKKYKIILDKDNPDFLFYSNFGVEFKRYNCTKIYFTGENERPDFNDCDYAFSFDFIDNQRNFRFPLYAIYDDVNILTKPKPDFEEIIRTKTKFCNFIYSNPANPVRNEFFKELSKYKKVDSYGRLYNNANFYAQNKIDILQDYKFTIAFENSLFHGYTTEKIFEPMLVHSMPIYWGNPLVNRDFNTKSFVNYHDFNSMDEVIEYIIKLDKDESEYFKKYKEPYFHNNKINEFVNPENLYKQLDEIFNTSIIPVSASSPASKDSIIDKKIWMFENKLNFLEKDLKRKVMNFSFLKLQIRLKQKFHF